MNTVQGVSSYQKPGLLTYILGVPPQLVSATARRHPAHDSPDYDALDNHQVKNLIA